MPAVLARARPWLGLVVVGCSGPPSGSDLRGRDTGGRAIQVDDSAAPGDSGAPVDADGDGVAIGDGDCDDADPSVFPGAPERWGDGVDQDCDGVDRTHAEACADAVPCPDAAEIHASAEAWVGIEQCTSIPGTLSWTPQSGDGPIPNTCLLEVGGDVVIERSEGVQDLGPLQRVVSIGGDLKLISLPGLADLAGLASLQRTGEHILILRNPGLETLDGLATMETVGRKLGIEENPRLEQVDALLQLDLVGEALTISDNTSLCADRVDGLVDHVVSTNPAVQVSVSGNGGC